MATAARSRPLVGKYAFWVRDLSSGIQVAKFQKATGGGMSLNISEYAEGGAQMPMKEITTGSVDNLTLEHGVFDNTELWNWVVTIIDMMSSSPFGSGIASPDHLRNFEIDQLRRDRTVLRTVRYYNCQPATYSPGEFDNTSTDIQVETLELAFEYFDIIT